MAAGITAFVLLISFSKDYLSRNDPVNKRDKDDNHEKSDTGNEQLIQHIDQKIAEAIQNLVVLQREAAVNFSEDDRRQILADIQAKLETDAFQSYVDQIREIAASRMKEDTSEFTFKKIVIRLSEEIFALTRRGNLNLLLGIGISIAGIAFLGYSVIYFPTEGCSGDSNDRCAEILLTYLLPRFSLVILIEIFAYFFLRLYKQSLGEIKYYQNEITNIEAKQLAIQLAMRHDDQALRTKVAEELAKTERNFILEKDQSTVEIEREKLASNNHSNLINALKDIVNNKKGG